RRDRPTAGRARRGDCARTRAHRLGQPAPRARRPQPLRPFPRRLAGAHAAGRLTSAPHPMTHTLVRTETRGRVRVITVDNPPVNALSPGVPEGIAAAIDAVQSDPAIAAIVVTAAGRTFVAGADITTLEPLAWDPNAPKPELNSLLARVESSTKPVVMAIHGSALGGGLEMAMAAAYRVAVAGAKLGLPECALGIIPGAEGTQRLPRLAGVEKALNMVVTSRPVTAADALAHGIIDEIV